ncbi:MAG: hypothetical protein JXA54_03440 [Candidatus Heimdallarchaeota archaeon]|nr:hypothetical protein [Candidatus Heimdallarchaeota archaeon]
MICFDSDFIIDFLRGNSQAIEKVRVFESTGREIVTTDQFELMLFGKQENTIQYWFLLQQKNFLIT